MSDTELEAERKRLARRIMVGIVIGLGVVGVAGVVIVKSINRSVDRDAWPSLTGR